MIQCVTFRFIFIVLHSTNDVYEFYRNKSNSSNKTNGNENYRVVALRCVRFVRQSSKQLQILFFFFISFIELMCLSKWTFHSSLVINWFHTQGILLQASTLGFDRINRFDAFTIDEVQLKKEQIVIIYMKMELTPKPRIFIESICDTKWSKKLIVEKIWNDWQFSSTDHLVSEAIVIFLYKSTNFTKTVLHAFLRFVSSLYQR